MEFSTFRTACKYAFYAYDDEYDHTKMSLVCKRIIPRGESWGKCDEAHCPYYGVEIRDGKVYQDGKVVATVESGRIVLS